MLRKCIVKVSVLGHFPIYDDDNDDDDVNDDDATDYNEDNNDDDDLGYTIYRVYLGYTLYYIIIYCIQVICYKHDKNIAYTMGAGDDMFMMYAIIQYREII